MKTSYLFLAPGFEEIEAVTPVDVMRRAGMDVVTVSLADTKEVTGANGVTYVADRMLADVSLDDAEWLIVPGGLPGSTNVAANATVCEALKAHAAKGGKVAAICAAPAFVLAPLGLLEGKRATCYPGCEVACPGVPMTGNAVEANPTLITANGPGAALPFAYAIVANSCGEDAAEALRQGMMYRG
ncbi:MAG: DJ-1/PfpI family protein [Muribaculaceae bacterium]|nr:DJ-1/PfpI family protein [Muribaculaceae bacterium]